MNQDAESRLTHLEELFSHQERLLQDLHSVVLELRTEHDRWKAGIQQRLSELEARVESLGDGPLPHEKPPHY